MWRTAGTRDVRYRGSLMACLLGVAPFVALLAGLRSNAGFPRTRSARADAGSAAAQSTDLTTHRVTPEDTRPSVAACKLLTDTLPATKPFVTLPAPDPLAVSQGHPGWEWHDVSTQTTFEITATVGVSHTASGLPADSVSSNARTSAMVGRGALSDTPISSATVLHLPLILSDYRPPLYGVIIEAVLYDGLQRYDYDEAVLILNGYDVTVDVSGWRLCTWHISDWRCADFPDVDLAPGERVWLTRCDQAFARSFGFPPDYVLSGWPRFANAGGEVALLDAQDSVRDLLVYRDGETDLDGWDGPSLEPYRGTNFALRGQVLYRYLDEETGLPAADTDTAADWAQYPHDPHYGRRVRYPGWSLERFYHPAVGASGTVTAGIAPDNAYDLVVDTIRAARETIEIEAYSMRHYGLTMELIERAQQGVTVTVLLEGGPVGGLRDQQLWVCEQLHATGRATCAFMVNDPDDRGVRSRYRFLHAKFMIIDRERLLISSQNFNHSGLPDDDKSNGTGGSRGVVLVTDAPEMVARAVEVFEADFDPVNHVDLTIWAYDNELGYGPPPAGFEPYPGEDWITYTVRFTDTVVSQGTWFELITAPEAALRSGDALLGLVARAGAGDAVFVQQLYERPDWGDPVSSPNLRLQAYIEAARHGARVRILINGGYFHLEYLPLIEEAEAVEAVNAIADSEGLDLSARMADPTEYGIHNKMVLVDLRERGQYAHIGSINGSETSSKVNRELAIQVRSPDLFDYLYAVFAHDWAYEVHREHIVVTEGEYEPDFLHAGGGAALLCSSREGAWVFACYVGRPRAPAHGVTIWR